MFKDRIYQLSVLSFMNKAFLSEQRYFTEYSFSSDHRCFLSYQKGWLIYWWMQGSKTHALVIVLDLLDVLADHNSKQQGIQYMDFFYLFGKTGLILDCQYPVLPSH